MDVFCSIKYKFGELREGVLYLSGKRCLSEKNSVVAHSWIVLVLLWHHNETFIVWELTSRASMDCVCVCVWCVKHIIPHYRYVFRLRVSCNVILFSRD